MIAKRVSSEVLQRGTASEENLSNSMIGYDRADLEREDRKQGI